MGLNEAARLAGKPKSTILRHYRRGRLSATRDEGGGLRFDTAELIRVYGNLQPVAPPVAPGSDATKRNQSPPVAPVAPPDGNLARLEGEIERLRREVERLAGELDAERRERRQWAERFAELSQRTVRVLTGPSSPAGPGGGPGVLERAAGGAGRVLGRFGAELRAAGLFGNGRG